MMVKFDLCSQTIEIKDEGFHMLRCISEAVAPSAVNVTYLLRSVFQLFKLGCLENLSAGNAVRLTH